MREAALRLARVGPNTLPPAAHRGMVLRVLGQFHHPLIYVLLASGAVTAVLGEHVDSAVIFGVVAVNAIIGFVQESGAEAALDSLRSMVRISARAGGRGGRVDEGERDAREGETGRPVRVPPARGVAGGTFSAAAEQALPRAGRAILCGAAAALGPRHSAEHLLDVLAAAAVGRFTAGAAGDALAHSWFLRDEVSWYVSPLYPRGYMYVVSA